MDSITSKKNEPFESFLGRVAKKSPEKVSEIFANRERATTVVTREQFEKLRKKGV